MPADTPDVDLSFDPDDAESAKLVTLARSTRAPSRPSWSWETPPSSTRPTCPSYATCPGPASRSTSRRPTARSSPPSPPEDSGPHVPGTQDVCNLQAIWDAKLSL